MKRNPARARMRPALSELEHQVMQSVWARAVRHILDRFCQGSVDELVSGLVEANVLSDAELDALESSIRTHARARAPKSAKKGR